MKCIVHKNVGFRLEGRWTPTYVNFDNELFCDPFGFCFIVEDPNWLHQGQVNAGIVLRF